MARHPVWCARWRTIESGNKLVFPSFRTAWTFANKAKRPARRVFSMILFPLLLVLLTDLSPDINASLGKYFSSVPHCHLYNGIVMIYKLFVMKCVVLLFLLSFLHLPRKAFRFYYYDKRPQFETRRKKIHTFWLMLTALSFAFFSRRLPIHAFAFLKTSPFYLQRDREPIRQLRLSHKYRRVKAINI